jgi:hypothetical protein
MKRALCRVKKGLSTGSSSHDTDSHNWIDSMSLDSLWSASYIPSLYGIGQLGYPPTKGKGSMMEDDTDIIICDNKELVTFESLRDQEYTHTHVYNVTLRERVGVDIELPTILYTIGWEKLYEAPHSGSCLLTLEFLTIFESYATSRKSLVCFRLFKQEFKLDYSHFSDLLDFSSSCLPKSRAMKNFSRLEFCDEISGKSSRIRFSNIHNPTLRFLHRWMSFTLFLMRELRSTTVVELRCLFAMVCKIRYFLVADIVDYFKEIHTLTGPIECTSMVTRLSLNLGCPEMSHMSYIKGDVLI